MVNSWKFWECYHKVNDKCGSYEMDADSVEVTFYSNNSSSYFVFGLEQESIKFIPQSGGGEVKFDDEVVEVLDEILEKW